LVALLALLLAGLAVGLTLGLRRSSGPNSASAVSVRAGDLLLTVPRGFHRYAIRGGIYRTGTRPPVIGYVITDYAMHAPTAHNPGGAFDRWADQAGYTGGAARLPPANEVALQLEEDWDIGVELPPRLHLPLSLNQPWFYERLRNGLHGYRYGLLGLGRQTYKVFLWTGAAAPPSDRAAVLNALASIRPAP
jgi:hypothetical protein